MFISSQSIGSSCHRIAHPLPGAQSALLSTHQQIELIYLFLIFIHLFHFIELIFEKEDTELFPILDLWRAPNRAGVTGTWAAFSPITSPDELPGNHELDEEHSSSEDEDDDDDDDDRSTSPVLLGEEGEGLLRCGECTGWVSNVWISIFPLQGSTKGKSPGLVSPGLVDSPFRPADFSGHLPDGQA